MKYLIYCLFATLLLVPEIVITQDIVSANTDFETYYNSGLEDNVIDNSLFFSKRILDYKKSVAQSYSRMNHIKKSTSLDPKLSELINYNNGNVRIGDGTAEQKLHIFGNTKISDSGNSDGKLYIGTTLADESQAQGYNLLVGGKAIMTELKVNVTSSWPDYVFNSDYELMPLKELSQFIDENHHLPGIPSAEEIEEEKGFQVGQMQSKLLEKIEELTLYIIDLKKENELIRNELSTIKDQLLSLKR